ncbi:hypothetical protein [Nisaea sp.]|uniref:hypothetical protein n=1 Tax=Nisaea sp. TaxID=2024842 RepID=UPI00329901EE
MPYAWVQNNCIRDIAPGDPAELYHSDIAALYSTQVAGSVERGAKMVEGEWTNPPAPVFTPPSPVTPPAPVVSPVEFKLLFTSAERIAIKAFRAGTAPETEAARAVIDDWYEIVEDLRLTEVDLGLSDTIEGVNYLETLGLIGVGRAAEILAAQTPA